MSAIAITARVCAVIRMEIKMDEKYKYSDVSIKSPIVTKLENFWYHYKWHSIIAAFLVVVLIICSFQMCTRTTYDVHILYAGAHKLEKTSSDGDLSPFLGTVSSLKRISEDFDENGSVDVNLLDLFVMTSEEISEFYNDENNVGKEINEIQIRDNTDTLESTLLIGNYYVCFLSEALFQKYEELHNGALFADLSPYISEGVEYEYASERGIYIRSLDFYSMPYISELPDDTVVCIRRLSDVSGLFGGGEAEESFRRAEILMREILGVN